RAPAIASRSTRCTLRAWIACTPSVCGSVPTGRPRSGSRRTRSCRRGSAWAASAGVHDWIHRIAVNIVLNDGRTERRQAARLTPMADAAATDAGASGEPEARMDLARAVAALPRGARTVLVLHDVEGYRHEEIARMLGIAPGTAKAQLHRARMLLRTVLER